MSAPASFTQYAQRQALHAEAHARPPMAITQEDAKIWHWSYCGDQLGLTGWPEGLNDKTRHALKALPGGQLRYERHTEFMSVTYSGEQPPFEEIRAAVSVAKGEQFAGVHIDFRTANKFNLKETFGDNRLFGGVALFKDCNVWTDFIIREDGLVHYVVLGQFEDAYSRGRMAKRLIDIETYRMAALLGLPIVREQFSSLISLEKNTSANTTKLKNLGRSELSDIVNRFADILAQIVSIKDMTRYRIAASLAYYEIVQSRLQSLDEQAIGQHQTLKGFIEHRLNPAIKTIQAFERRLDALSVSVESAMALARTQLDLASQVQNQKLLQSMDRRANQQLRLSQAVEGLSVAAITYYAAGLVSSILKPVAPSPSQHAVWIAISIPVVGVLIWWVIRSERKKIQGF